MRSEYIRSVLIFWVRKGEREREEGIGGGGGGGDIGSEKKLT